MQSNSKTQGASSESGRRVARELQSLREKIRDLEALERELRQAQQSRTAGNGEKPEAATADEIVAGIETRLGYVPAFFDPARKTARVLESLWRTSRAAYYDNPLPALYKEKLCAYLSRYCTAPYLLITHCCALGRLEMPAHDILKWLDRPLPSPAELERALRLLEGEQLGEEWPAAGTDLDEALLLYGIFAFMSPARASLCADSLEASLGPETLSDLTALLAYIKLSHFWTELHREITYATHPVVRENYLTLISDEPRVGDLFRDHYRPLVEESQGLRALRASEQRYRDLIENAQDMVYTQDLGGVITSMNRAGEHILGYGRAEAVGKSFLDLVAPEHRDVAQKAIGSFLPGTYELDVITKAGQRVALEVSTQPMFEGGRPTAIQGFARNVTERKKTEAALHDAKRNLEDRLTELEHRTREMTLLSEMTDLLRACITTEEAYDVIVRTAREIFPVEVGTLYSISPSRNLVEAAATWGDTASAAKVFPPGDCWALRRGRMHAVQDAESGLVCRHLSTKPRQGYVCVPMMAQSEAIGVLHLVPQQNLRMGEPKQRLAVALAEHIAMALSNLRLHETLKSQLIRDPLTGLFNRRFMEESLELELRRATRNQRPLCVIMIDIDRFKSFNDTFGHDAGDAVLKELGALVRSNVRGEDIACRYGGEEFTLVLPEGSLEIAQLRAQSLREAIKRLDVRHHGQTLGRVTISLGLAVFPEHGKTGEILIRAADTALYQAKAGGGDLVVTAR